MTLIERHTSAILVHTCSTIMHSLHIRITVCLLELTLHYLKLSRLQITNFPLFMPTHHNILIIRLTKRTTLHCSSPANTHPTCTMLVHKAHACAETRCTPPLSVSLPLSAGVYLSASDDNMSDHPLTERVRGGTANRPPVMDSPTYKLQPATPGLVSCQTLFEHNIIWTFQSVDPSRRMPLGQFETTDRRTQQDTLIPTLFIKSDSFQYQQSNTYQHLLSPAARLSAD